MLIALQLISLLPKIKVVRSCQPCNRCMHGKTPWTCIHNMEEASPWRDDDKARHLMFIYGRNTDSFLKEQMGAVREDSVLPFLP